MIKQTDEWYVTHSGSKCPFCNSDNITSDGRVQTDDKDAWQEIRCNDCHKIWNDIYTLMGYEEKG